MPSAWRIVRAARVNSAFTGEGGRVYGGRWNSRGTAVVYVSEHESLAALELFVHDAACSDRAIPLFPARVGGQTDRILFAQESPATLERRTAHVRNDANRRRLGPPGKFRCARSAERAKRKRDELPVKSQALRFQKDQDQQTDRISLRSTPIESLMINGKTCRIEQLSQSAGLGNKTKRNDSRRRVRVR